MKIEVTKRIHLGYREWKNIPNNIKKKLKRSKGWFGKWQYFYENPKGVISMIKLNDYHITGEDVFEIYCIDGTLEIKELLPDTKQFTSKPEAEIKIKELLS